MVEDQGFKTYLSTRLGKHGPDLSGTEVPRQALLAALEKGSKLFSMLSMTKQDDLVHEETIAP